MKTVRHIITGIFLCLAGATPFAQEALIRTDVESAVSDLLSRMTLEQKIGQMIQGEIKHVSPGDLRKYGLGSVLNGGGSFPDNDKHASARHWLRLADAYHHASTDTSLGNAGIPVMWGTDAVHGHNNVIGATLFPHNIGLGAARDPALIREIGKITAIEVAATGIDWIFAPTVAVAKDDRWGRTYESYSDQAAIVEEYAPKIVEAIQEQGIVATAKHFIGDGATHRGVDQGDARLDLDQLLALHGKGYESALHAGVMTVMASFNSWNGDKIHGNRHLLTDVLKTQMGFEGFVVSDWNGVGQVDGCEADNCPQAINAGVDMVMAPEDWKSLFENLIVQVESGVIPLSRIDDAVRRILRVKILAGIINRPAPSARASVFGEDIIGHPDHRRVAREAVRKSLVLLKNNGRLLPLNPAQKVLVAGSGANDIGRQNGGWTISWQGTGNSNEDFPHGTSVYGGIAEAVAGAGGNALLSPEGEFSEKPDVAIVVFGETPYAEGSGDIKNLMLEKSHERDYQLLKYLREENIPVVSVLLTGRPLWVNREINASDAFVVAWLPGSEGAGIADVIFSDPQGDPRFDFKGSLSFDWPGIDLNSKDPALPVDDILFEYGYGLSYGDPHENLGLLSEHAIGFEETHDTVVFKQGTRPPWKVYIGDAMNWSRQVTGPSISDGKIVSVTAVDKQVQEDARRIAWHGDRNRKGQIFWQSEEPVDLTPLRRADGALSLEFMLETSLDGSAELRMDCGWPCNGSINIGNVLRDVPVNKWVRISVPLSCFERAGLNLAKVDTPLLIAISGRMTMTLSEILLLENPPAESLVACETVAKGIGLASREN